MRSCGHLALVAMAFLVTHAVLQRSGVAEVHAVAPRRGRVSLYPVFQVEVAEDVAGFDHAHPGRADYVIVPAMLALVEAIGGRAKAEALAAELGVASWSPEHDSAAFGLNFRRGAHYLLAKAAFWRNESRVVDVRDGMDDIALALAADAWSRTGHVSVEALAAGAVKLRSGLMLLANPAAADTPRISVTPALKPVEQFEQTLEAIEARFGAARREWVAVELELPVASR